MSTELAADIADASLKEVDIKKESELIWEIVGKEWQKMPRTRYLKDDVTVALENGNTLKFEGNPRLDKYARWATANKLVLHRKSFPGFTIAWATKVE